MPPRGRGRAREEEEEEEVGHPPAAGSSSSSGARAGSSSSGRHSNVHSHADQRIMTDSIKTVLDLLGELSKRVKNNKEGVPAEVIQRWKEQIVQLAKEAAKVLKLDERYEDHAARLIQEKFGDLENAESINISELDFDGIQEKIEKLVKADMKSFKPDSNTEVKKIIETCTKKISEEDEDIVMEDTEIRESDLKCPFTLMPMLRPMKNTNPQKPCIHHVSPEGLEAMTKGKGNQGALCPVAGCSGKWLKNNAVEDEDQKRKIERYLRRKRARTEGSEFTQSAADAVDLD